MRGLKYDEIYLKENIRFYDAKDVPHFNEKTPEGVFNAEYDCQLDASPYLSIDKIKNWIINGWLQFFRLRDDVFKPELCYGIYLLKWELEIVFLDAIWFSVVKLLYNK